MIRLARPADLSALRAMEEAAFGDTAWSMTQLRGSMAQPAGFALLLEEAGTPAGHVLGRVAVGEAELLRIGVDPQARRGGRGRQLLAAFHAEAARRDAVWFFLEVSTENHAARALYRELGWREAGRRRRYYRTGVDALVLTRPAHPADQGGSDPGP